MTAEGRLARGKTNYEAGVFLTNSETLEYISTLKQEEPKEVIEEPKPKEKKKNAKRFN